MRPAGERFAYPLVATYARRFYAPSCVLIGDAAVGMHPVTAHGFNFGLRGVEIFANLMDKALKKNGDFGGTEVLLAYDRRHRMTTRPLYLATNLIATLFAKTDPCSIFARRLLLNIGQRSGFFQDIVSRRLTDAAA